MNYPPWATGEKERLEYLIGLAALHNDPSGSVYRLSCAIGRSRSYLIRIMGKGRKVSGEDALKIADASHGAVPAHLIRPDLWPA